MDATCQHVCTHFEKVVGSDKGKKRIKEEVRFFYY